MGKKTNKTAVAEGRTTTNAGGLRQRGVWLALLIVLISLFTTAAESRRFVPGRILVKTKAGLSQTNFAVKLSAHRVASRQQLRRLAVHAINLPEAEAEAALAALRCDPEIEFAERDFLAEAAYVPNDPYASGSEWHLARIEAGRAWDFTIGHTNMVVAVVDSGVNAAHPDLADQLVAGYDFVNYDADPADDFGHGTAVAGTVAAAGNNRIGVVGVAYGARVLPVKVMDSSGFATYSCMAQGIRYAVDQGARIINISLAGASASRTLQDAVDYAWSNNVVVVAAAGNNADDAPQYPAACSHVVAVSATDSSDARASFSSFGTNVTLAAPGDRIWTTQHDLNHPYGSWRGTSFAGPIVAGVAALAAAANPTLSGAQIVSVLEESADDLGPAGWDSSFGRGRVNAYRAVSAAFAEPGALEPWTPPASEADTEAPSVTLTRAPANHARVYADQAAFSGTADDDQWVERVEIRVNDLPVQAAVGTSSWSALASLSAGENIVRVRSVDAAGNASPEEVRTFTQVVLSPLSAQTNGWGWIRPNLDGRRLEIGRIYSMKAVPGRGQVFAGWSGEAAESPALRFAMRSNLTLVANFVPTPFRPVAGTYSGLIVNTNGVLPDNSGGFSLRVTALGQFTGKLRLAGRSHGFSGRLNLAGDSTLTVSRKHFSPLTLSLHVDLTHPADQVSGLITSGGWTSGLSGDRNIFNSRLNPAQQAGVHAFILQQADTLGIAASGTSSISRAGITRVKGRLQDGRAFSAASTLAKDGDFPFHLSMSKGGEVLIGRLNFPGSPSPVTSGTLLWVRTGTKAFAATLTAASPL